MKTLSAILICTLVSQSLFAEINKSAKNNVTGFSKALSLNSMNDTKAALPVLETYIPANVISTIEQRTINGNQVYDITSIKAQAGINKMQVNDYVVRFIKDGIIVTETLDANGTTASDVI